MTFQQYNSFKQAKHGLEARGFTTTLNYKKDKLYAADGRATYEPSDLKLVEYHRFSNFGEGGQIIFAFETQAGKATLTCQYKDRLAMCIVSFIDQVPMGLSQPA